MVSRHDLMNWVFEALKAHRGEATIVEVAQHIWERHEPELKASGDLFYTWQYDMRWAAYRLRKEGIVARPEVAPDGKWALNSRYV